MESSSETESDYFNGNSLNVSVGRESEVDVKTLLECPVCFEIPLPPIYLCKRGHIVCSSCQDRTQACPICRDAYTNTRSFVAEGIVESCSMRCKYREHGCNETLNGATLAGHLKICDYRPLRCGECAGAWILYNKYWEHLLEFHQINGINNSSGNVVYTMKMPYFSQQIESASGESVFIWPPYYFKCFDDKTFLLKVRGYNKTISAFVCLLGPKADIQNYKTKIEFNSNSKPDHVTQAGPNLHSQSKFKCCWEGELSHFRDDPIKDVSDYGLSLCIPISVIQNVATTSSDGKEKTWVYSVTIKQEDSNTSEDVQEERSTN